MEGSVLENVLSLVYYFGDRWQEENKQAPETLLPRVQKSTGVGKMVREEIRIIITLIFILS